MSKLPLIALDALMDRNKWVQNSLRRSANLRCEHRPQAALIAAYSFCFGPLAFALLAASSISISSRACMNRWRIFSSVGGLSSSWT